MGLHVAKHLLFVVAQLAPGAVGEEVGGWDFMLQNICFS